MKYSHVRENRKKGWFSQRKFAKYSKKGPSISDIMSASFSANVANQVLHILITSFTHTFHGYLTVFICKPQYYNIYANANTE